MKRLGKIKTLTIASLSAVALAAPIAFAQTASTTQDTQRSVAARVAGMAAGVIEKAADGVAMLAVAAACTA